MDRGGEEEEDDEQEKKTKKILQEASGFSKISQAIPIKHQQLTVSKNGCLSNEARIRNGKEKQKKNIFSRNEMHIVESVP